MRTARNIVAQLGRLHCRGRRFLTVLLCSRTWRAEDRIYMRIFRLVAMACVLCMASPLFAQQEWIEYKNIPAGFAINAPGEPKAEMTT